VAEEEICMPLADAEAFIAAYASCGDPPPAEDGATSSSAPDGGAGGFVPQPRMNYGLPAFAARVKLADHHAAGPTGKPVHARGLVAFAFAAINTRTHAAARPWSKQSGLASRVHFFFKSKQTP